MYLLPLTAGLLMFGACLTAYYLRHIEETDRGARPNVGLMVSICNALAYLLGPIALAEAPMGGNRRHGRRGTAATAIMYVRLLFIVALFNGTSLPRCWLCRYLVWRSAAFGTG
jgi:hypothetical protein